MRSLLYSNGKICLSLKPATTGGSAKTENINWNPTMPPVKGWQSDAHNFEVEIRLRAGGPTVHKIPSLELRRANLSERFTDKNGDHAEAGKIWENQILTVKMGLHRPKCTQMYESIREKICWPYRAWKWCHICSLFGHCFRQFRGLESQEMKYFLKIY